MSSEMKYHRAPGPEPSKIAASLLRDIGDVIEVAGIEDGAPLPLVPDFAEVIAKVRNVLTVSEIAEIAGVKDRQVHHWAAGTHNPQGAARSRLLTLYQVISPLETLLSTERIKVWLWSPHPDLLAAPVDCLKRGDEVDVLVAAKNLALRDETDDEALVELAKSGNSSAYDALVRRYRGFVRLKASSYFLLGGEPDDLVQEGLLGLYKAIRDYRTEDGMSFPDFAKRCITRQIITAVKTAVRQKNVPRNEDVPSEVQGEIRLDSITHDQLELKNIFSDLAAGSGVLSDLESNVLSLYLDGHSYEAIAERLECDIKTTDNALQRAKRKIAAHLVQVEPMAS